MAHKKGLLKKYITDPEETDSSCTTKSPIHDGKTWIIPETSNSDNEISKPNKEASIWLHAELFFFVVEE